MDPKIEQKIKEEWHAWGNKKPWYCPKCNCLMNKEFFPDCEGGYHPYKGVPPGTPLHDRIVAQRSVTFEEFCAITYKFLT